MKTEIETGGMQPQAWNTWRHQKLEEAKKDSFLELPEEARLCQHLDFKLLASRTVRK